MGLGHGTLRSGWFVPLLGAVLLVLSLASPARAGHAAAPVPTGTPGIAGEAVFGATLTHLPAPWAAPPAGITLQWLRNDVPVPGATGPTYTLGVDDLKAHLTVTETATDTSGSTSVTSAATGAVARARFEVRRQPELRGVARFGRTLSLDPARFSPRPDKVKVRWVRDEQVVARGPHYRLGVADVGSRVHARVIATREGYQRVVASTKQVRIDHRVPARRHFTYSISTRGAVGGLKEFARLAQATYDDPRGWRGAGFAFRRVARGGDFTLVLSAAGLVPSFSSGCSATWSCRVGRYVIINQTRWRHASPAWNQAKRSLRDYRHMVVNHETGHWLGHGHAGCRRGPAPVMMQQSKGVGGCRFNPWPLPRERWTAR